MAIVKSILTNYAALSEIENNYLNAGDTYVFLGKVDQWPDDVNPPTPSQSPASIKETFKNMFAVKKITASNIAAVIPRIDWVSGTVYEEYSDQVDNFITVNGIITKQFYVRNSYDQIFKCLFNNDGADSTIEPVISPGNTNTSRAIILDDGYKWIYITTIDKGLKQKFFDDNWMPVSFGAKSPRSNSTYGFGSVDAINVISQGSGYSNGFSTTTITITGDGQGATAQANVSNNIVTDIIVTNSGNNYTYANVTITPVSPFGGANANATIVLSPISGNNYDPASELGCNHLMYSVEFDGSEGGEIPTDMTFRQVGLLQYCSLLDGSDPQTRTYNTADIATVSFGIGVFEGGEIVYQGASYSSASYIATVCSFDSTNNLIYLINTVGTPTLGSAIYGNTSGASRVLLSYSEPEFDVGSGYMSYIENREPVQRSPNDSEQIRFILGF
jgi:hypothetical protein